MEMFDRLFRIVDLNDDGVIEGALGASFLRRSELSDETLREVWRLACGGKSRPSMTREPWFLAMKMIAMAQQSDSRKCPSLEDLSNGDTMYVQAPNFGFGIERVVMNVPQSRISPEDARIRVQNPSTQSSAMGIRGHTLYEIFTKTNLKHFVFKQMRVRRRFKEFVWLRGRLSRRYIGLVIPKLPAKRLYGNMDPHFIEERRMELQLFLNYILRHPLMSQCLELEIFLTASRKGIQDAQIVAPSSDTIVKSVTENAWNSLKNVFGTLRFECIITHITLNHHNTQVLPLHPRPRRIKTFPNRKSFTEYEMLHERYHPSQNLFEESLRLRRNGFKQNDRFMWHQHDTLSCVLRYRKTNHVRTGHVTRV